MGGWGAQTQEPQAIDRVKAKKEKKGKENQTREENHERLTEVVSGYGAHRSSSPRATSSSKRDLSCERTATGN